MCSVGTVSVTVEWGHCKYYRFHSAVCAVRLWVVTWCVMVGILISPLSRHLPSPIKSLWKTLHVILISVSSASGGNSSPHIGHSIAGCCCDPHLGEVEPVLENQFFNG